MLSDHPDRAKLPSGKRRAVGAKTSKSWSDSQKIEAVTTYLAMGNLALTARLLKIPDYTLREWKTRDWWKDVEHELRLEENLQLSSRLQKIIQGSLAVTEDRIANGDYVYDNKTGSMIRKPVSMKDAHKVTMDMINKREDLTNQRPVQISNEALDERLAKLAKQFEEIAERSKTPQVQVTDVIVGESHNGS